jgi:putative transposase
MPRIKRSDTAGSIYHAINRGNARSRIFHKAADYEAFLRLLGEGLEKYPLEIFSLCLMPNHWHLVLRPRKDGQMGRFLGWVTATHTLRYRAHNHRQFPSHLYQGPFKSFPVADDEHFLVVCRYVERNALRAKLCDAAEDWQWGSLHRWHHQCDVQPKLLSAWPISRLPGWVQRVNEAFSKEELEAIRTSVNRGQPFGSEEWVEERAEKDGLWSTLRPVGRPRGKAKQRANSEGN